MRIRGLLLLGLLGTSWFTSVTAVQLDPIAPSLQSFSVPVTPGLTTGSAPIIVDTPTAIQLGKALFWDMNVGSDDVACATCHFHAGADRRIRNVRNAPDNPPNLRPKSRKSWHEDSLTVGDFPVFSPENPMPTRTIIGSSGMAPARFLGGVSRESDGQDRCIPQRHGLFPLPRQVTSRNAPSVIDAAFNFRNFWDGRANNRFNGQTAYGARDPDAGVYEWVQGQAVKTRILLENAALASQATLPPVDEREMSCKGRMFPDIARKLLARRPLERQAVHPEDSVLATLRHASGLGLATDYAGLIRKSFAPRYWDGQGNFGQPAYGGTAYRLMEINFAFFFGLAVQMYESTLIADATRFDSPRDADGYPSAYSPEEKRGLDLFNRAECDFCHRGPAFSAATHPALFSEPARAQPLKLVERRVLRVDRKTQTTFTPLTDVGYANIGVTPDAYDAGLGGSDPWGQPLSFAAQYLASLAHPEQRMIDPVTIVATTFSLGFRLGFAPGELTMPTLTEGLLLNPVHNALIPTPSVTLKELAKPRQGRLPLAVKGTFKVPSLRNVELTGPYMHNGSLKSLDDVIDFYDRGGHVDNPEHFATFVFPQHFTSQQKTELLAFLKTLTDERVRWEQAPFDHPALRVPNGQDRPEKPSARTVRLERWLDIPAVGRAGRSEAQGPLLPFVHYLENGDTSVAPR